MDYSEIKTPIDSSEYHTTATIVAMCLYVLRDQASMESYLSYLTPAEA